jgi:hypothetical protein
MPTLIVDMESGQDMMSALELIAARVTELSTSDEQVSLLAVEEASYHADLPRADSQDFADEPCRRARGTDVMILLRALVSLAEVEPSFSLLDVGEVLDVPEKDVRMHMRRLERIENQLRSRLLASIWGDFEGCYYYAMHRTVRKRLAARLSDSQISD